MARSRGWLLFDAGLGKPPLIVRIGDAAMRDGDLGRLVGGARPLSPSLHASVALSMAAQRNILFGAALRIRSEAAPCISLYSHAQY